MRYSQESFTKHVVSEGRLS